MEQSEEILKMEGITKEYEMGEETSVVLKGIDLSVRRGEFLAVLGPSGSGKSTLMNIIGCLDVPTSGDYWLHGKLIADEEETELARIRSREVFYRKAFSDRSQNAVSRYIYDYFVELGSQAVCRYLNTDHLDTRTLYAIKSHSFACVGHTMEWLEGISKYTPMEFAALQYDTMPGVLKKAYGITGE